MVTIVTPERRAIRVAIVCSVVGAVTKFVVGFMTGSMSMISSAIDSLGDLFISVTNLFVVRYADRAPDHDHNYGHSKIEGLGAMFEGGFIFASGLFIVYESIHKLLIGEVSHSSLLGILVMVPLLLMTSATVVYLRRVAQQTGSLVIQSDALHYLTDVWVNVGVLVSLVLVKVTGRAMFDSIISIGIALYMIWSSLHVVRQGFDVVMDKSLDPATVKQLQALLSAVDRVESFHDFRTRGGKIPHVEFHVVVRPEMTARQVHDLFTELQGRVRDLLGPAARVLMHADPADDHVDE